MSLRAQRLLLLPRQAPLRRLSVRPLARSAWSPPAPVLVISPVQRRWAASESPPGQKYPSDGKAHGSIKEVVESAKVRRSVIAELVEFRSLRSLQSELKGARDTLADSIAGGHAARSRGGLGEEIDSMAFPITISEHVPRIAWAFGAAGVVPYLATSLTSIYLARQASLAKDANATHTIDFDTADALLYQTQQVQLTYGAVILSFLGAIHWGFEFSQYGEKVGARRLILGILPLALAWPSLMLPAAQGLVVQLGAFFLAWYTDNRATSWGWTPRWYSTYRFALTAAVGATIVITLTGSSYFDPKLKVPGIGEAMIKQHAEERQKYREGGVQKTGEVRHSDLGSEDAGDDSDHYIRIRDYKAEEEERQKKEEEEREAREEEEQKEEEAKAAKANEKKKVAVKDR